MLKRLPEHNEDPAFNPAHYHPGDHARVIPLYDEKTLLARVATGDQAAFSQLFRHWYKLLAAYVFRITESRELTEEIVQDVFTKIWMVRETLRDVRNFKHFILVVCRNKAFDILEKQLRERERRRAWEKDNEPDYSNTEKDADSSLYILLEKAIESLPPRRKQVFLLSRNERLTYKEIAVRLGISKDSVKTHLRLASASVADFLRSNLLEMAFLFFGLAEIL